MQEGKTQRIYDVHSRFYDLWFGRLVKRRIRDSIGRMRLRGGQRVLDVGVGTGVSLPFYPSDVRVIAVDLSAGMLQEARRKCEQEGLRSVTLLQADALRLPFADNSFDHVFISHVISVVSDPVSLLRELQRVARRDAPIVVLNHFASDNRLVALLEKLVCPITERLGWRSDLQLAPLVRETGVQIDYRYKLQQVDFWETVVFRNTKSRLPVLAR